MSVGTALRLWAWAVAGVTDAVVGPAPRPRHVSRRRWALLAAAAVAAFPLLIVQYGDMQSRYDVAAAVLQAGALLVIGVGGPLWAWRSAVAGVVVGVPATSTPGGVPIASALLLAALGYLVALSRPRRTAVGVWLAGWGALALATLANLDDWPDGLPAALVLGVLTAAAVALGDGVRARRQVSSHLESARAEQLEGLAREAVLRERTHIARELHDLVAHHMTTVAWQSEAALLRHPDLPEEVARRFTVIRDAARESLGETRRLVAVLRDEGVVDRLPQPGVPDQAELVSDARAGGMAVALTTDGDPRPLPATIDVAVYRLVQEALSNARRHAPGARVTVALEFSGDRLRVRVADDGVPA